VFPQIVEEVRYVYSLLSIRNLVLHKMDSVGDFLTTEIGVNLVLIKLGAVGIRWDSKVVTSTTMVLFYA